MTIAPISTTGTERHRYTLADWDKKSSVRTTKNAFLLPSTMELELELENKDWFPPAFLPYLNHPLIKKTGKATTQRLSANHLVYFLDYTTILEHKIVNRSVEILVHGELGIAIPQQMKTAALQLYTDEGYHALFSDIIAEQVARLYTIKNRHTQPHRITRLLTLVDQTGQDHIALAWFFVGFVSETIIAKELLCITRNTLVSSVYQMLKEHLEDEARHSRYFSEVFHYLWSTIDATQHRFAADLLLDVILIFFEVDAEWLTESLMSVDIPPSSAAEVIISVQDSQAHIQRARAGATATLLAMKKSGFFDLDYNQQLFIDAGLIDA